IETNTDKKLIQIEIFDPPMCCQSGLCGPDIDPTLLDINEAILKVKKEFDGQTKIERYLLSQQGPKFMQQPEVMKRLQTNGVEILPLTLVDGKVVKEKGYKTLLLTTDPAAHIGEVLEQNITDHIQEVKGVENLWSVIVDQEKATEE